MFTALRRHGTTIAVAFVTAAVTAAAPVIADSHWDANNADKVDGKHAVGAGASMAARAGRLVATNGDGRLPNDIIAKAPDSARLGGLTLNQVVAHGSRNTPILTRWSFNREFTAAFRSSGGNVLLLISTSGEANMARAGFDVIVDGIDVGSVSGWVGADDDSPSLPTAFVTVPGLAAGDHTLRLVPFGSTNFGGQKSTMNVSLIEFGVPDVTFTCEVAGLTDDSISGALSTTCRAVSSAGLTGTATFGCQELDGFSCDFTPATRQLQPNSAASTELELTRTAPCPSEGFLEDDFRAYVQVGQVRRYVQLFVIACTA